ncbi:MAG TPA: GlsB/YeaQ/YmgE family stress response membrane protein, partial [Gemmatimonadaceae bacterium]
LMKGSGYGTLMDIVVGIIGALIGGFIMRALGFVGRGGMIYTIIIAIIGAVILTWLVRLVTGGKKAQL